MNGVIRQFEPQITRSGGAPSKYRFTVRCSDCANADTYEASRPTSDDAVRGYFKDRGWLLGRAASFDLCPACLARPRQAQTTQPVSQPREAKALDKRHRDTADILARHLGKPEALAAEVFRPKEATPIQSPAPQAPQPTQSTPALSPEIEQALSGMAADLKSLRAAVELVADQMGKLIILGGQQIEAVARLAPALLQSAEGLSGSLRQVASAVQTGPHPTLPAVDVQPEPETALGMEETTRAGGSEPAAATRPEVQQSSRRVRGKRLAEDKSDHVRSAPVIIRSIADSKRSDRYYTSIRLPRNLWDQSGFGPDDRLLLDWSGNALSIERAAEGGVKPKSIGDATVVLQSWKLGNINFDQLKVAAVNGSLCLTTERRRPET